MGSIDCRNIWALVGVLFAIIGISCSGALYGKIKDIPQCCGDLSITDTPDACTKTFAGFIPIPCTTDQSCSTKNKVWHDGCCIEYSGSAGKNDLIFGAIILGTVVFTGLMAEFSESCPACAQNCSACILGTANILGLGFVILVAYFVMKTSGADDTGSSSTDDCSGKAYNMGQLVGQEGLVWAELIFLILAQLCSCVVAIMTSSCFQPDNAKE